MAEVGSHPGSWNSFAFTGLNTQGEEATLATMPEAGTVTSVSCFVGGDGSAVTARFVIWRASDGAILAQTGSFSLGSGSRSSGGQAWVTQSLSLALAAGAQIYIGWWRDPAGGAVWSLLTSGTYYRKTDNSGSPGAFTSPTTDGGGQLGAYATYTPTPTSQEVYVDTVKLTTGTYVDGAQVTDYLDGTPL